MPSLLMIAPAPVIETGGRVRLDVKFVEGMRAHAALWQGRITCVLWRGATALPFGAEFAPTDLGFDLVLLDPGAELGAGLLAGHDVIYASGDDHLCLGLADLVGPRQRLVYAIEYTQETRLQILRLDKSRGWLRMARSAVWLAKQERRRKRAFAKAAGLQANGYPAYDLYGPMNRNSLLYLDGRMTPDLFATEAEMAARAARLQAGGPLRLIYSGRLEPMKGAQDLMPVARRLASRGVAFCLDIFGTGSLRDAIAAEVAQAGEGGRIRLHAPVDFASELVPFTRKEADMFLGCHRQSDPSCTYLEAMGCGVAVASYDNRMWARLNAESAAGWGAPLGQPEVLADRIAEAAADTGTILARGRAALAFSQAHDFPSEFRRRMDHLAQIAGDGGV
jgi:colanic acid/amylovoran biosynthesis glycosyltransferase